MKIKKSLLMLATLGTVFSAALSGCSNRDEKPAQKAAPVVHQDNRSVSLPGGAGVLLKDKQVVLIPQYHENRAMYEKRLADMNAYTKQTGYTMVSIIDLENKAAYDTAMFQIYPIKNGKMYNMIDNPISSWASMQISGSKFVAKYTPGDIAKAQAEAAKKMPRLLEEQLLRKTLSDKLFER